MPVPRTTTTRPGRGSLHAVAHSIRDQIELVRQTCDVLLFVCGGKRDSEPGGPGRHGRWSYRRNPVPALQQPGGGEQGGLLASEHDRDDRARVTGEDCIDVPAQPAQ